MFIERVCDERKPLYNPAESAPEAKTRSKTHLIAWYFKIAFFVRSMHCNIRLSGANTVPKIKLLVFVKKENLLGLSVNPASRGRRINGLRDCDVLGR